MKLRKLPLNEFNMLAASTRLRERTREMARAVLVDGRHVIDVAAEYGMTFQRVQLAVKVIEKAYMSNVHSAGCIVKVTLELPEEITHVLAAFQDSIVSSEDKDLINAETIKVAKFIQQATNRLKVPANG